jgi:colanic acid biosynthesis glycosyl transferase WcaI
MRLLLLGINYWPEDTGIAVYNTGKCEYLAARGHDVTMCTGFPYYPWWRIGPAYRGRIVDREMRNGVGIVRSWLYVPRRVTSIARILHEASFIATSLLRATLHPRPDLLVVVSPPLGLVLSARLLSRLWKVPYVLHVPDLQPDAALDLGMLRGGRIARLLFALERFGYRHAALVSTLTQAMRQRIVSKGVPEEKVALLPDWADGEFFDVPLANGGTAFRRTHGLEGRFLVMHAGNMGVKQGLDVVLDAAAHARTGGGLRFLLVGDGAARPHLEEQARTRALPNVQLLPLQPRVEFLEAVAAADVGLVTQQESVADIVFPSKVLTLFAAGRCVVASVRSTSEVARVVRDAGAGVVVPPGDAVALLEAVRALQADPARRRRMAEHARAYARQRWSGEQLLPRMEAELQRLVPREVPCNGILPHAHAVSRVGSDVPSLIAPGTSRGAEGSRVYQARDESAVR